MKHLLIILMITFGFVNISQAIEPDKEKHFAASAGLMGVSYVALRATDHDKATSLKYAVAITLGVGILKEATDERFDMDDIKYNVFGMTAIMVPIVLIEW